MPERNSVTNRDLDPHPLAGVRVLELGQVISAPYAGLLLADLGAEVIKVEPPLFGDSARDPAVTGMGGISATFVTFNHNKGSIALDLKDPAQYAALIELVRHADVFLTNTIPAVAQRLRIDPATLRPLNPRLITCSIQGFQDDDIRASEPSYDLTHQALAGYMLMEGSPGDPPARVCIPSAQRTSRSMRYSRPCMPAPEPGSATIFRSRCLTRCSASSPTRPRCT
jgi:crotonobetainyl-CoA:carnitine CoA-transferase CaiB-like acyl-CoA transferase